MLFSTPPEQVSIEPKQRYIAGAAPGLPAAPEGSGAARAHLLPVPAAWETRSAVPCALRAMLVDALTCPRRAIDRPSRPRSHARSAGWKSLELPETEDVMPVIGSRRQQ